MLPDRNMYTLNRIHIYLNCSMNGLTSDTLMSNGSFLKKYFNSLKVYGFPKLHNNPISQIYHLHL